MADEDGELDASVGLSSASSGSRLREPRAERAAGGPPQQLLRSSGCSGTERAQARGPPPRRGGAEAAGSADGEASRRHPRRLAPGVAPAPPAAAAATASSASRSRPAQRAAGPAPGARQRPAALPRRLGPRAAWPAQEPPRGLRPASAPRRRAPGRAAGGLAGRWRAPRAGSASRGCGVREQRPPRREPCEANCYAYCLADGVDCRRLHAWWAESTARRVEPVAEVGAAIGVDEPAHVNSRDESVSDQELQLVLLDKDMLLLKIGRKDCFVFGSGCLVCWGCTLAEVQAAKKVLLPFSMAALAPQDVDEDQVGIADDEGRPPEVCFSSREPPIFERLALAYALAQSVRLGSLELRIERSLAQTRTIPETLARTGHVHLSSRHVTKMIGELFAMRSQVNLETDILDTPEFFWDYEDCEELYLNWRQYLDLDHRVSILNQRFEVVQDLFDALEGELNERKAEWLEWVIILIVACDVVVMAFRLYFRWSADAQHESSQQHRGFYPLLRLLHWFGHQLIAKPVSTLLGWAWT